MSIYVKYLASLMIVYITQSIMCSTQAQPQQSPTWLPLPPPYPLPRLPQCPLPPPLPPPVALLPEQQTLQDLLSTKEPWIFIQRAYGDWLRHFQSNWDSQPERIYNSILNVVSSETAEMCQSIFKGFRTTYCSNRDCYVLHKICRFGKTGNACNNVDCIFYHKYGLERKGLRPCMFGDQCHNYECEYAHYHPSTGHSMGRRRPGLLVDLNIKFKT